MAFLFAGVWNLSQTHLRSIVYAYSLLIDIINSTIDFSLFRYFTVYGIMINFEKNYITMILYNKNIKE